MTPAVRLLTKEQISFTLHEYDHDPEASSFGEETVEKLGLSPDVIFKTLITEIGGKNLAAAILPVSKQLDLKLLAKAIGSKKASMADKDMAAKITGYIPGAISPFAMKKRLKTIIDSSAENLSAVYVSGGRRGLQVEVSPADLSRLTHAGFAQLTR